MPPRFVSTRTNEVKKVLDEQQHISVPQDVTMELIHEDLQVMNQTLAMTCDYLCTIANTLSNINKGGK